MKKLVPTLSIEKPEWLEYRRKGIGGSDAGAVCGLNPYRTSMEVYRDKIMDDLDEYDDESMRQGRDLEDYVARRFMEATGKKVRKANYMYYDENHPFMIADVDRMIVGENAGLECKTASPYMEDKWADGKIPISYQIQCLHYMSVCNADAWYIAVLIYGREFKYYKIERDEEMLADLIRIEEDFWENCVVKGEPPEPDGSVIADSVIAEYFKKTRPETIELTGFNEKLKRREELIEMIGSREKEKRKIEQELKMYLGEAEYAKNWKYRVSWKPVSSQRIDEKRLKEERPEVYEEYQKTIQYRRLLIKAA